MRSPGISAAVIGVFALATACGGASAPGAQEVAAPAATRAATTTPSAAGRATTAGPPSATAASAASAAAPRVAPTSASPAASTPGRAASQTAARTAAPPASSARPSAAASPTPSPKPTPSAKPSPTAATAPLTITISGYRFSPSAPTAVVGQRVRVVNRDGVDHTWTGNPGPFDSGQLGQGQAYDYTFSRAGSYSFVCSDHTYMTGRITVR